MSRLALLLPRPSTSRAFHISLYPLAAAPSLLEVRLRDRLKTAMKAKDRLAATCLKSVLADVTNVAKAGPDPKEPASEGAVITTLRRSVEKRREAALSYAPDSQSAHEENHTSLLGEISLLESFLPPSPSSERIRQLASQVVDSLPDQVRSSKGAIGPAIMGVLRELGDAAASVDRKEVGKIVGEVLKGR